MSFNMRVSKPTISSTSSSSSGTISNTGISSTPITLPSDPVLPMHAATKQYVDNSVAGVSSQLNTKVSKSGDTVTGPLVLQYTPTQPTHAITKQYADNLVATTAVSGISLTGPGVVNPSQQATSITDVTITASSKTYPTVVNPNMITYTFGLSATTLSDQLNEGNPGFPILYSYY